MRSAITKVSLLAMAFLLLINFEGHAQKVKYKDLYFLLSGRKYDEAEPFLKQFLAEDKNKDHPNANYQMAVIYQKKAEKADIFQEAELVWIYTDSAVIFYNLAKEYITDKEVKRNSEYYEDFSKRDMRTGKVSVKSFDIHFAIDEIIESITARQAQVAEVNDKLLHVITQYNQSRRYFIDFKRDNQDFNEMLLRANLQTIGALDHLIETYDSFQSGFTQMKNQLKDIPNSGYSQQIRPQPIEDFMADGESESAFLEDDIKIWDYDEWGRKTKEIVLKEILPLKALLVEHDEELQDLLEKAQGDSAVFTAVYNTIKAKWNPSVLMKYDNDPLPVKLFDLRYAELEYFNSMLKSMEFRQSNDYANRIKLLSQDKVLLKKMDSLVNNIAKLDIDEQIRNYTDFVDKRYKGYLGLDKYLKDKVEAARKYGEKTDADLEALRDRNAYMVVNESKYYIDTTFITPEMDSITYSPKFTDTHFSSGYQETPDGIEGYLVEVNPQRATNIFYTFTLDSADVGDDPDVVATTDGTGQVFYVLYFGDTIHTYEPVVLGEVEVEVEADTTEVIAQDSTEVEVAGSNGTEVDEPVAEADGQWIAVYPAILCKIYRVDGLAWISPLNLKDHPVGIRLNDLGEIVIDEESDDSGRVRSMLVVSNKDGTIKSDE